MKKQQPCSSLRSLWEQWCVVLKGYVLSVFQDLGNRREKSNLKCLKYYRNPNRFVLPQKLWTSKIYLGPYPYNTNRRCARRGRRPSRLIISYPQQRGSSLAHGMLAKAIVSRALGASGITLLYFQLIKLALTRKVMRAYLCSSKKKSVLWIKGLTTQSFHVDRIKFHASVTGLRDNCNLRHSATDCFQSHLAMPSLSTEMCERYFFAQAIYAPSP